MTHADAAFIDQIFRDTIALHDKAREAVSQPILDAADRIVRAVNGHGKLLIFGNGGSATDAEHAAAELVGRFEKENRRPLRAIALTTDTSVLTSVGNDLGFEQIFARQVEALGQHGDIAFGITTSGNSPNVVEALTLAKAIGLTTIALTGHDGGRVKGLVDVHINVPADSTARVQEVHRTILHILCALVERAVHA